MCDIFSLCCYVWLLQEYTFTKMINVLGLFFLFLCFSFFYYILTHAFTYLSDYTFLKQPIGQKHEVLY